MQASRLKLGAETIISLGICRRRPNPALLTLPSKWQQAAALGINNSSRTFAVKAVDQPVHATPHYMDYDTLVDMHIVTRQSFGNRPLFGTKRGNGHKAAFEWLTYKDFGKQVDRCRAALASKGIGRGDAVAIISTNREEWAVCAYATYSLGAVFVPMYEEQHLKDWRHILDDSGAKFLFVSTKDIYHRTFHFAGVQGDIAHVFCFDLPEDHGASFKSLMAEVDGVKIPPYMPDPSDVATLIYTSGTTGKPKGVMISHSNIISNIVGLRGVLPEDLVSCHDRSHSFLPWAHCYGQTAELHALMAHGASMGISKGVSTLVEELAEVKPTLLYAVPQLFKKVLDTIHAKVAESSPMRQFLFKRSLQAAHHRKTLLEAGKPVPLTLGFQHHILDELVLSKVRERFGGNLKASFVGGAATSMEVLNFFENINIKIIEGYGLTETSPLVTINTTDPKYRRLGSTGRPLEGVDVKIFMDDEEMPHGEEGEVCVSGPNLMLGYHNMPEATEAIFFEKDGERFLRTGDLGRMDEGTYLKITGRIKEQFKLENGKYVVPSPIEAAIISSTYISQALVYGDNRPYCVALVFPDWELLTSWAETKANAKPGASKEEIASMPAVRNLIAGEIQLALEDFKKFEIPRNFELLEDGFTKENDMLTQKLSVKRHTVIKHYHDTLLHLYGDRSTSQSQEEDSREDAA